MFVPAKRCACGTTFTYKGWQPKHCAQCRETLKRLEAIMAKHTRGIPLTPEELALINL